MDSYASGGIGATVVLLLGLAYRFIDHKRIRSRCCGYSASISIDEATPKIEPPPAFELKNKTPE
jgi:hypothetical protein